MWRAGAAAAVLVVLVLVSPPGAMTSPGHTSAVPSAPVAPAVAPAAVPAPTGAQILRGILQHNLSGPSASPVPNSGYQETPPPPLPATTPTVVHVITNGQGCCFYVNQTPAGGPWDSVVLNYTGTVIGGVYDSSYRAYVGGAEVLFGTTPEYGTWTVLQNLTKYESLLEPGANFTFILSAAVTTGYFESSLTLSFYPPPPGGPVPPEPSKVVPIWTKYVQASLPVVSATATVPRNASAASLELWSYGFGSTGGDEFWWASAAPARSVDLSLDGTPFVAAYPFPSLNTGGVDLFLWRPLPAAYTLSYRPQTINLTGALGAIDGTHTYNVTIGNRHAADPWWTAGTLLLWTDPNVSGAALVSSGATWPSPMNSGTTVTSATSFHFSSTLTTSAGPVGVATQGSGTFRETEVSTVGGMNGTSWTNISQSSGLATQTTVTGPNGTAFANSTRTFTFSTDLGSRFVESSNTGGGYPIEGNATIFMLNFQQEWTELATWATVPAGGPRVSSSETIDNEVSGANGIFSTEEKLTSATASPQVLAYTLIQSATPKYTAELRNDATGTSGYARVLTGSDYQPTDPNLSETILENRLTTVPAPLGVVVTTTPDPVDLGQTVTLSAIARGGAGVYGYSWSGLPPGCGPSASAFVTCAPSLPGTYAPVAVVTDSSGASAPSAGGLVVVAPRLGATLVASAPGSDVGLALSFAVAISGGVPPFACSWSVGGTPSTAPCNQSVPATTSVAGSIVATVFVTDGTGALVNATSPAIPIHDALIALLQPVDPTAHARVGVASNYTVAVEGGTAPVALTWYLGDSVLPGFNGTSLSFVPDKTGNLSISVRAVDAAGGATRSNALTVPVAGAASSNTTGPNPGSSSSSETVFWVAVGLAALAGVEAIFLLARYLPPKPPSRQG